MKITCGKYGVGAYEIGKSHTERKRGLLLLSILLLRRKESEDKKEGGSGEG